MTEPFWKIENTASGLSLSKDGREVVLPWPFVARVASWNGPPPGKTATVPFEGDDSVRVTISVDGLALAVDGSRRPIRLPFVMLKDALAKHDGED